MHAVSNRKAEKQNMGIRFSLSSGEPNSSIFSQPEFIESQNHRMAWVEKDHNDHWVPTPCYVQGHQPPAQAAQSHVQPGLECLQGWGIHSLLGQPVQCATTPWGKIVLLISNLNLPCLSLRPFPLVLLLSTLVNSRSPSCLPAHI